MCRRTVRSADRRETLEIPTPQPPSSSVLPIPSHCLRNHYPTVMDAGDDDFDGLFNFQWASQSSSQIGSRRLDCPRSDGVDESPVPVSDASSTRTTQTPRAISPQQQSHQEKLTFVREAEWDAERTYDEKPPICIRYTIEWKVTLNGKAVSKDTEPEVVLAPDCFWRLILQPKLERVVRRKFPTYRRVRSEDTEVTVSVTERSKRPLITRFEEDKIVWDKVEKRLLDWGQYFQKGKELRLNLSFNHVEAQSRSSSSSTKKGDKRGRKSASSRMLAERDRQLDAEEEESGQPALWPQVYAFMGCPGPACDRGPHCWIDPDGKKHYPMRAPHLRSLIEHVARFGMLQSHDDVPQRIRDQLYSEEQQRKDRKVKEATTSPPGLPPINITNVLPGHPQQMSLSSEQWTGIPSVQPSNAASGQQLEISGFRDDALCEYTVWQQSQVRDSVFKAEFGKCFDAAMKKGLSLEQIYEEQDVGLFVQEGAREGIASRFCRRQDILSWTSLNKRPRPEIGDQVEEI